MVNGLVDVRNGKQRLQPSVAKEIGRKSISDSKIVEKLEKTLFWSARTHSEWEMFDRHDVM